MYWFFLKPVILKACNRGWGKYHFICSNRFRLDWDEKVGTDKIRTESTNYGLLFPGVTTIGYFADKKKKSLWKQRTDDISLDFRDKRVRGKYKILSYF